MDKKALIREIRERFHPSNDILQDMGLSWWVSGLGDNGRYFDEEFRKLSETKLESLLVELHAAETIVREKRRENEKFIFDSGIWRSILDSIPEDLSNENGFMNRSAYFHERALDMLEDWRILLDHG